MVVGQSDDHHRSDRNLLLALGVLDDHWAVVDGVHAQHGCLRHVDDGRAELDRGDEEKRSYVSSIERNVPENQRHLRLKW